MELDITEFFNAEEPGNFSASAFELGDNAGTITWRNAKEIPAQFTGLQQEIGSTVLIVYSSGAITLPGIAHLPSAVMAEERKALEEAYSYQQLVIAAAKHIAKGFVPAGLYTRQGSKFVKYN